MTSPWDVVDKITLTGRSRDSGYQRYLMATYMCTVRHRSIETTMRCRKCRRILGIMDSVQASG